MRSITSTIVVLLSLIVFLQGCGSRNQGLPGDGLSDLPAVAYAEPA